MPSASVQPICGCIARPGEAHDAPGSHPHGSRADVALCWLLACPHSPRPVSSTLGVRGSAPKYPHAGAGRSGPAGATAHHTTANLDARQRLTTNRLETIFCSPVANLLELPIAAFHYSVIGSHATIARPLQPAAGYHLNYEVPPSKFQGDPVAARAPAGDE
jgi:hypothetical protein